MAALSVHNSPVHDNYPPWRCTAPSAGPGTPCGTAGTSPSGPTPAGTSTDCLCRSISMVSAALHDVPLSSCPAADGLHGGLGQQLQLQRAAAAALRPMSLCSVCFQPEAMNAEYINGPHPGLQQRGGEVVGTAAGQLALEVPAVHAAATYVPRARHNVCACLRLLPASDHMHILGAVSPTGLAPHRSMSACQRCILSTAGLWLRNYLMKSGMYFGCAKTVG